MTIKEAEEYIETGQRVPYKGHLAQIIGLNSLTKTVSVVLDGDYEIVEDVKVSELGAVKR
jgi:hypothetical protein